MILAVLNVAFLSLSSAQEVATVLQPLNADVICLNEVDKGMQRSNYTNQARVLAKACGYPYYRFGKSQTFQDGSQTGNAILSKHRFDYVRNVSLPFVAAHPRAALVAGIKGLRVICTHLNGGPLRNAERIQHLDRIDRLLLRGVMVGDFNHTPDRDSHLHALTLWQNAGPDDSVFSTPHDRRDFIYLKGLSARNARIVDSRASDHKPVVANIL
jgi:endonuclease/exonuclease/phosphatase family metal-dependent hydrolase